MSHPDLPAEQAYVDHAYECLDRMRAAYAHAIDEKYRFYSYGDACLLERVAR